MEQLNWESVENHLANPKAGSLFLVKGYIIKDGRSRRDIRLAMFNGNMFLDYKTERSLDDMVIECWTVINK